MDFLLIPALAVLLDIAFGEPPNAIHPVAWMGKVISLLEKGNRKMKPAWQFIYGAFMTLFTAALFTTAGYYLLFYLRRLDEAAYIIVAAILLKLMFSIRGMNKMALRIKALLEENNLEKTRFELRGLVSRATATLETPLLASAAVESVAEGACDSLVAPLFFYLIFGVPGAIAYRVVNTLDSMVGYRGKYEYLGKFAARLDDVLNFIPARLAALVLSAGAVFMKGFRRAWRTAFHERKRTSSPNAGWPMALMAGALEVRLEKPGEYVLGDGFKATTTKDIGRAVRVFSAAAAAWTIICLAAGGIRFALTG